MTLLLKLCSLSIAFTMFITHTRASGQRSLVPPIPAHPPPRQQLVQRPSTVLRPPRRAARQNQPYSYSSQSAQYYRPNYQPPSGNAYFDPSYEPSNYRESYNNPSANPSMTLATYPSISQSPTAAYSNAAPSYNIPSPPAFNIPSGFDASSFDASHEPSSYQPKAVKASPSQRGDHENSESRLERQGQGGGGQDTFVDFGAHSGNKGSFGWYADFPVHKDT